MHQASSYRLHNFISNDDNDDNDQLETLADLVKLQPDSNNKTFWPRPLRLSNSFPSLGHSHRHSYSLNALKADQVFKPVRPPSKSISLLENQSSKDDSLRFKLLEEQLLGQTRPSPQRLRTRSLDRKPKEIFNLAASPPLANWVQQAHTRKSSADDQSTCSSYSSAPVSHSSERHLAGFHSHIPIERTALSVLPSSRKSSINSTTDLAPVLPSTTASPCDSFSVTFSDSPKSTLATSVNNSTNTSPRPRYQPRPLLLSAFSKSQNAAPYPDRRNLTNRKIESLNHEILINRQLASVKLEKAQQLQQQKLHAREAKKLRKRHREAELCAISSSLNQNHDAHTMSIPDADEDDRWSWLSCSDAEEEEESQDEDSEEMAVVWRASLDVGRRVSKTRKALGRGHGICLPSTNTNRSQLSRASSSSPSNLSDRSVRFPHLWRLQSFIPYHHFIQRQFFVNLLRGSSGFFLLGSGFICGFFCSTMCQVLSRRLPALLQKQFIPISSTGIGLFFNLIFPQSTASLYSTSIGFLSPGSIGTSMGLCTQW